MKPSPIGSKLLSGYAILFAGVAPAGLATVGFINGMGIHLIANMVLSTVIVYFGVRVFVGDYSAVRVFATLVVLYYLGITAANAWNYSDFPADSRAAQMAIPRMLRGVIFASLYAWYYLFRRKTVEGFYLD
jgi:hypothetical protein